MWSEAGRKGSEQLLDKYPSQKVFLRKSTVDECVFYRGNVMYVLYTDDFILAGPDIK